MSYVRIWIHAVWATKYRAPVLTPEILPALINHIRDNAREKGIRIDRLNGHIDHIHCLFRLNADMSVARALLLLKGESAHWINKERILAFTFRWGKDYYARSVGGRELDVVRAYIDTQKEHHQRKS
jgi:REP element-mobilizing transposase RayT